MDKNRVPQPDRTGPPKFASVKKAKAIKLLMAGVHYREVAKALGIHHRTVWNYNVDIRAAAAASIGETVTEIRGRHVMILEAILYECASRALLGNTKGHTYAVRNVVAVQERISKLCGLDMPTKTEMIGKLDLKFLSREQMHDAISTRLREFRQRLALQPAGGSVGDSAIDGPSVN